MMVMQRMARRRSDSVIVENGDQLSNISENSSERNASIMPKNRRILSGIPEMQIESSNSKSKSGSNSESKSKSLS